MKNNFIGRKSANGRTNLISQVFFAAACIAFIYSCTPKINVSTDFDRSVNFANYKTFSMYALVTSININELNEKRIWLSIREEMKKKGYVETNQHPDLMVNAFSVLKNKMYVSGNTQISGARGYGWARVGMASGSTTFSAQNYKEGSLVIDVIDNKTNQLIWEGTGKADLEKRPKNPDEAISYAVNKILESFPQY